MVASNKKLINLLSKQFFNKKVYFEKCVFSRIIVLTDKNDTKSVC